MTTTFLATGGWVGISVSIFVVILIAVFVAHRYIMRRRRRQATRAFAEGVQQRSTRNDADHVDVSAQKMAALAERTEKKLKVNEEQFETPTLQTDQGSDNGYSKNPFWRSKTLANQSSTDTPTAAVQSPGRAWLGSEYLKAQWDDDRKESEMIPMQGYGTQ